MEEKPKIFCFSAVGGGAGIAYAISEDGHILGSHWCSHEGFIPGDLGVNDGSRPDRHEKDYSKHYPDGYEMEFVRAMDIDNHSGLKKALEENNKLGEAQKEYSACSVELTVAE
jgi:hypothetical protein